MRTLVIALMLLASTASGQQLELIVTKHYALDLSTDPPTAVEIKNKREIRVETLTTPPVDPKAEVTKQVSEWAVAVNEPLIATALSEALYGAVADDLESGKVDWEQAERMLRRTFNLVLTQSEKRAAWEGFRGKLKALTDEYQREGRLFEKDDQVKFLREIQAGLAASAAGKAIDIDRLRKLLDFIRELIEFFRTLFGSAPAANDTGVLLPNGWKVHRHRVDNGFGSFIALTA